jgi:hypothetical protein
MDSKKPVKSNMRKKTTLISLAYASCLLACNSSPNGLLLNKKATAYWDIYSAGGPQYGYRFEESGECGYYWYEYGTHKRRSFKYGDLVPDLAWEFRKDSLYMIGRLYSYKFKSSDTLLLMSKTARLILVRSTLTLKRP